MAKKKEGEISKQLLYVQVRSIEDLARSACRFDSTSSELLISKYKKKNRLISLHEGIGELSIALYTEVEKPLGLVRYYYGQEEKENAAFVQDINRQDPDCCYIDVLDVDLSKIKEPKKVDKKSVVLIRMNKVEDLIRGLLKRSMRRENIEHAYSFPYKGGRVVGAFEVIDGLSEEKRTFYYAILNSKVEENFARYDFINNKFDFSNEFGNHSYMYVKIINLTEPFRFFQA